MTSTSSSGASQPPFVPTPTRALVRSRRSRSPVPRSPAPGGASVPASSSRRTVRPGPRHHASRGRSPVARRWGVGGGLRPPAAAVGRPAGACPIVRRGRHGIARCDVPQPERIGWHHPQVRRRLSQVREGSGSPPGRWARLALNTTRCGCSTAGCSFGGAGHQCAGTSERDRPDLRRALRPGQRDVVSHREHAQAPCAVVDGGGFPPTLLRDGKVLVGDVDDPAAETIGAEVYDPDSGTWTATGKMVDTRVVGQGGGSTATVLRDGKVLVAGPIGAQLYDPDSGTWTATGKMITPRHSHTATLLPDGKVLVVGGTHGAGQHVCTRPSCTTRTRGPGPPSRTCIAKARASPALKVRWPRCCTMAPCSSCASEFCRDLRPGHRNVDRTRSSQPGHGSTTTTLLSDGTVLMAGLEGDRGDRPGRPVRPRRYTTRAPGRGLPPRACSGAATTPRSRYCSMAPSSWLVAGLSGRVSVLQRARRSCTSLPACRRRRCRPSRARPRQSSRARPRSRRRSRPRPVPFRRTRGPGRSRSTTGVPSPRRCSWPRWTTSTGCYSLSGPRPRTWSQPAPP